MIKVAITGGIASGKSMALNLLKKRFFTLSADEEIGKIYQNETVIQELQNNLGVNTKEKIKELIKQNPSKIKVIERILYKELNKRFLTFERMCRRKNQKFCFYEVPLLFEKNMQKEYDFILNIETTLFRQKSNFIRRSKKDISLFNLLKKNQLCLYKRKILTQKFKGVTIKNTGTMLEFKNKLNLKCFESFL